MTRHELRESALQILKEEVTGREIATKIANDTKWYISGKLSLQSYKVNLNKYVKELNRIGV